VQNVTAYADVALLLSYLQQGHSSDRFCCLSFTMVNALGVNFSVCFKEFAKKLVKSS
jgi:hypothetical protein